MIQDLVEDSPDEDLEQLLSLSAAIVIKLRLGGLDDKKKKRFATIFRKIASKIEAETVVNGSLWDALWGRSHYAKDRMETDV